MKKSIFMSTIILLLGYSLYADSPSTKISGFVRLDSAFDTRQGVVSRDGSCYLYPKKVLCDDQDCDINNRGTCAFSPAVTRLRFSADSPRINNMDLSGMIEFDFFAYYTDTTLGIARLRLAYLKAIWEKFSAVIGQDWHPIYPMRCFPDTVDFGGGSPIDVYARYPQICFDFHQSSFGLKLAAYSQFQFCDTGPDGETPCYMQNSMTPGLYGCIEIRKPHFFAGAGINMQRLMPSLSTTTTSTTAPTRTYVTDETITSYIGTVYCSFDVEQFVFKAKGILGQNGYPFGSLGGYVVGCMNTETGRQCFKNINFASVWGEIVYQKYTTMEPGIFIGISKSIGTRNQSPIYLDDNEEPIFYGFDSELHQVIRIAPRIKSTFHHVHIGLEANYTKAWFGKMNSCGKQPRTCPTSDMRILLAIWYTF